MNSRSSVNETNLVNFSADTPTLNQLESKDGLLSFPFDHIYACHSEGSDGARRQGLQLDKEVEISTLCAETEEDAAASSSELGRLAERLANSESQNKKLKELLIFHLDLIQQQNASDRLTAAENQNKRLKELLIHHHDLIQQQNDAITKREKLFQALKQENETLKSRLHRIDRRVSLNQKHSLNPPPLVQVGGSQTPTKTETATSTQIMLNSLELLIPDNGTNSFIFDSDIKTNNFIQDSLDTKINSDRVGGVSPFLPTELGVSTSDNKSLNNQEFKMIESKRTFVKKELKTDTRADALYTVTGNSANPVIQRIQRSRRRPASSTVTVNRVAKSPSVKVEPETSTNAYEEDNIYDRFTVNKKSKMINTYGKSPRNGNPKKTIQFTGSLSDRLQLIDTTPTGEDPYQLGEADMREQSPIPKLMLQKTNHGRMRICSTETSAASTNRHLYATTVDDTPDKGMEKIKLNRYNLTNTYMHHSEIKKEDPDLDEAELDMVKTEAEIDWQLYSSKPGTQTSVCDFSYGETPNNLATNMLPTLGTVEFQDLYTGDSGLYQSDLGQFAAYKSPNDKNNRRTGRTTSLVVSDSTPDDGMPKPQDKPARKRALSTTGLLKTIKRENTPKSGVKPKPIKGKAACRGKKSPLPGVETRRPYHTLVGDPDVSWYLGLDPDIKTEDVDQPGVASLESTVEVPRWREKPYSSCYTLEGTENLDDKVFEKRHQKLEAEERRQLRWHMRRIREQRHVERLRQRQRDSWSAAAVQQPATFTVWPRPQGDVKFIEITDTLPVNAFGEPVPAVPEADFVLPWVRTSKALKRSKRSKTLH